MENMEKELRVALKNPVEFEGEAHTEINLNGLYSLTVADAAEVQKRLGNRGDRTALLTPEVSQSYLNELAARAAGLPVEFFENLPIGECRKVRLAVQTFLNQHTEAEGHVLMLAEPYIVDGAEYTSIDLSGVMELTGRDVCAAEREVANAGISASEPSTNIMYCCCIAAKAAGKTTGFFTGMPLREALYIRAAVNDADFFE